MEQEKEAGESPLIRGKSAVDSGGALDASKGENVDEEVKRHQLRVERKRLRQILQLAEKSANGHPLNPDQQAKLARRAEVEALIAQLEASCSVSSN
ncbi:unnamed protein product [Hydatigera taeniaeformis]|uniref:Uncharacterized protein n=1 Tax=Hydatigena taeniaeformis TaxID=6205 RepID=A0A0R3WYD0_HYDTA|nr:unnamed protein product [Hydatigera taeniaeformis]